MADLSALRARALASLGRKTPTAVLTPARVASPEEAATMAAAVVVDRSQLEECLSVARQLQAKGLRLPDLIKAGVHASFAKDVFALLAPPPSAPPQSQQQQHQQQQVKRSHEEAFPPLKPAQPPAQSKQPRVVPQSSVVIDFESDSSDDDEGGDGVSSAKPHKEEDSRSRLRRMEDEIAQAMKAINKAQQKRDERKVADAELVKIRSDVAQLESAASQLGGQIADNGRVLKALDAEKAELQARIDKATATSSELAEQQRQVKAILQKRRVDERAYLAKSSAQKEVSPVAPAQPVARPAISSGDAAPSSSVEPAAVVQPAEDATTPAPAPRPASVLSKPSAASATVAEVPAFIARATPTLKSPAKTVSSPAAKTLTPSKIIAHPIELPVSMAREPSVGPPSVSSSYVSPLRCLKSFRFSSQFLTTCSSYRSLTHFNKIEVANVLCTEPAGCACGRQHLDAIAMTGAATPSPLPPRASGCRSLGVAS